MALISDPAVAAPPGRDADRWLGPWLKAAERPEVTRALLGAAEAQGALAARLTHDPRVAGAEGRLALAEIADAMWLVGDAGARDRLALYAEGAQGAVDERDQIALWALRRIKGQGDPAAMSVPELRAFLGLAGAGQTEAASWVEDQTGLFPRPTGAELDMALAEWRALARAVEGRHRLIRAAILHRAWRWLGLSGPEDQVTPLVVAVRIGGAGGPCFAPLTGAARRLRIFAVPGDEAARLTAMLRAFADAAREAALMLERVVLWRARAGAGAGTKAMRALVAALAEAPVASTKAVARQAGMSPQAINGAARALLVQGLIAEATGQSRFRLWQAAI